MQTATKVFWVACFGSMLLGQPSFAAEAERAKSATGGDSSVFTKDKDEGDDDFVARFAPPKRPDRPKQKASDPDSTVYGEPSVVHGPISTLWNAVPVIVVLYEVTVTETKKMQTYVDHSTDKIVDGYVFASTGQPNQYRRIFIGSIEPDGGDPEIEAVFFANADRDANKELVVLVKWEQLLHADYSGTYYGAFIYDDLSTVKKDALVFLSDVTDKLGSSSRAFDRKGRRLGKNTYATAAEVRRRLKKLGY